MKVECSGSSAPIERTFVCAPQRPRTAVVNGRPMYGRNSAVTEGLNLGTEGPDLGQSLSLCQSLGWGGLT